MRRKTIMIEDRKIEDGERAEVEKVLKYNRQNIRSGTVNMSNDFPDGHIKSLRFKGGLQVRG